MKILYLYMDLLLLNWDFIRSSPILEKTTNCLRLKSKVILMRNYYQKSWGSFLAINSQSKFWGWIFYAFHYPTAGKNPTSSSLDLRVCLIPFPFHDNCTVGYYSTDNSKSGKPWSYNGAYHSNCNRY
jgi:hypothetical protein